MSHFFDIDDDGLKKLLYETNIQRILLSTFDNEKRVEVIHNMEKSKHLYAIWFSNTHNIMPISICDCYFIGVLVGAMVSMIEKSKELYYSNYGETTMMTIRMKIHHFRLSTYGDENAIIYSDYVRKMCVDYLTFDIIPSSLCDKYFIMKILSLLLNEIVKHQKNNDSFVFEWFKCKIMTFRKLLDKLSKIFIFDVLMI